MSEPIQHAGQLLRGIRVAWCASAAASGVVAVVGAMSAFVVVVGVADNLFLLPPTVRWACLAAGAIVVGAVAWRLLGRFPLFAGRERLAAYFEHRVPEADNHLINLVQLGTPSGAHSNDMAAHYCADAAARLRGFTGWEAFERKAVLRTAKWSAVPVAVLVVYAVVFWAPFSGAVLRLVHPSSTANTVSRLRIEVLPGDVTLVEGSDLEVVASIERGEPESVSLEYVEQAAPDAIRLSMATAPEGGYVATMRTIAAPRTYRVIATPVETGPARFSLRSLAKRPAISETYRVTTVPPPRVERFHLAYEYPEYTGRAAEVFEKADGAIKAPVGTQVTVRATCNKPLATATVSYNDAEIPATVDGAGLEVALEIASSGSYRFSLTGRDGFANVEPVTHSVVAVPDAAPRVAITSPDRDVTIGPGVPLPITFVAEDDYGLAAVTLLVKRGDEGEPEVLESFLTEDAPATPRLERAATVDASALGVERGGLFQVWFEAIDNQPNEPNHSRSRTLNVRIAGPNDASEEETDSEDGDVESPDETEPDLEEEPTQTLEEEPLAEKVEERLQSFVDMQREVIEQTNNLSHKERQDLTGEEKEAFKDIASVEDDLSKFLEELVSDLSELPGQDFSEPTLSDEIVEILAEVELAEDALELENKLMAITVEQVGLELAEELVHDLPKWLSDVPDILKWDMEEPPEGYETPMAELPEELTDMMGELIDEETAMTEEVEDESSSWADSIDAGAGWMALDGPISNMSAKGITGNMLPNSSEIGGRSGEGRSGRAHGEFVEKTAVGKGGRDTPTRLTPDPFESGVVEDSSTDPMGGATGGGKLSGSGGYGLRGPVPPEIQNAMHRLAGHQADIRAKAERLQFKLRVVNLPAPGLNEAIGVMREIEDDLRDFRYQNVLARQDVLVKKMKQTHETMAQQVTIRGERQVALPEQAQNEILEALDESVIPEYRDNVADYFRALAGSR